MAMMITFLNKTFRHACEGLYLDEKSMTDLNTLLLD